MSDVGKVTAVAAVRPRWRRVRYVAAAVVGSVSAAALLLAYGWAPAEVRDRPSRFLADTPTKVIDTAAVRFHYWKLGSGPPVLLLHGGGEWLYSWHDTAPGLAQRHTVIAVDLPGHGYTTVTDPAFRYDLPAMTAALRDLLDALGLDRVTVVGHSWGGGIALALAQGYPDRVSRMALIGSSGLDVPDTLTWRLLKVPVLGEVMTKLVRRDDVRSGLQQSFHHRDKVTETMVDEVWPPLTFRANRRAQYVLARRLDWSTTEAALPDTRTPTLVLWGRQDAYLSSVYAAVFGSRMPDVTVRVIDQCGHSAHEDCPTDVAADLRRFLSP